MKDFEEKVFEVLENVCLEYNASKQDIYEALDRFEIMFFELHNVKDENEMWEVHIKVMEVQKNEHKLFW